MSTQLNKEKPCSKTRSATGDKISERDEIVTPHKRADYESPKKKLSSRKRKRNESEWKSSVRKRKRLEGKSYQSKTGKSVKERKVQP